MRDWHQPCLPLVDDAALRMERIIRGMVLDDAVQFGGWRVEYLYLERGYRHYRVEYRGMIVGNVDIIISRRFREYQRELAIWLVSKGANPARVVYRRARTPLNGMRRGIPRWNGLVFVPK
ncbi:MAG: hypothetical protein D6712_04710 [Chloroflexi bacterium]|nr:MAG: hypothetical protein D6712_04710 [Chloroflexota bacterium]